MHLTKIIPKISGNVDYPEDTDVLETTLKYAVPKNALRKAMGLWNYLLFLYRRSLFGFCHYLARTTLIVLYVVLCVRVVLY
jgi:hypothetical protein